MIEQFSTNKVRADQRLSYWNDLMAETYSGLVVDPAHRNFQAHMSRWYLGDLTMICPKSSAASISRRPGQRQHSDDMVILHIVQYGDCILEQRKSEVMLRPGDMVVCRSDEEYRFKMASEHQVLVVEMSHDSIAERCPQLNDSIATRIPGEHSATRLLYSYLLSLWREGTANFDASMGDAYSGILKEMFAHSLDMSRASQAKSCGPLMERMKGIVEAHNHDATFNPATLASELGVSLRTLQNAMARMGTTATNYITDRRLAMSKQRLAVESI